MVEPNLNAYLQNQIKQGLNGRPFKTFRLFTTPIIYFLLLLFFMAAFIGNIGYIVIAMFLCGIGIIPGFIYGEHVSFFEKDEKIFYKRSPYILTIWAAGFLVRILLEFLYPSNIEIQFIVDALLAVTLGLIIGESIKTYIKYRQYVEEERPIIY